jgi:hypothetical protein
VRKNKNLVSSPPSQLFLTRLWLEPRSAEGTSVRIQVRHVLSGETYYFRDWCQAGAYLLAKLQGAEGPVPEEGSSDGEDA